MPIEIIILAMIAAFLGLRLYSVLGRRAEHEEETIRGRFETKPGTSPVSAPRAAAPIAPAAKPREKPGLPSPVERGLREISAADRRFETLAFVEGAKSAYRMILEAFWRGDKEELSELCDKDVYEGFAAAIDEREAAGERLDNRLIRINEVSLVSAEYRPPMAKIVVRFTADIASVTRDANDQVVAGSLDDAIENRDVWTFTRDVRSDRPDWLLDETDED